MNQQFPMSNPNGNNDVAKIAISAGGVTAAVAGSSVAAASAATIILATGGAAAIGLIGYGVYKYLSSEKGK